MLNSYNFFISCKDNFFGLPEVDGSFKAILESSSKSILSTSITSDNLFGIFNVYSLFTYSQQIVLSRCDCSHSWERTFMYYYSMLIMSLYVFLASFVLITVICCGQLNIDLESIKNIKKNVKNITNRK